MNRADGVADRDLVGVFNASVIVLACTFVPRLNALVAAADPTPIHPETVNARFIRLTAEHATVAPAGVGAVWRTLLHKGPDDEDVPDVLGTAIEIIQSERQLR